MKGFLINFASLPISLMIVTQHAISAVLPHEDVWRIVELARSLSNATQLDFLVDYFLQESVTLTHAEGGVIALVDSASSSGALVVKSLWLEGEQFATKQSSDLNIKLKTTEGKPNYAQIMACAVIQRSPINIADVHKAKWFDVSREPICQLKPGYPLESILAVPLLNHYGEAIGVLQLFNARNSVTRRRVVFSAELQSVVEAIAGLVSLALVNHLLLGQQRGLLVRLASADTLEGLFDRILWEAQEITGAEGATLYLLESGYKSGYKSGYQSAQDAAPRLTFAVLHNVMLDIKHRANQNNCLDLDPINLYLENGEGNYNNVATYVALSKKVINVADAYHTSEFDFSGTKVFDREHGYHSKSFLTAPLVDHDGEVIGVLQLINARDMATGEVVAFSPQHEEVVSALSDYAAVMLNNRVLVQEHKDFLDAFVKCMAKAIDAKSRHTGVHCQRVPVLTEILTKACCDDQGVLKDFILNQDDWYELQVAAWLHDCGKLATPEHVLNKSTKLDLMKDGFDAIEQRMELVKKEKMIELLSQRSELPLVTIALGLVYYEFVQQIHEEVCFIKKCNRGAEYMPKEHQQRIREIAQQRYWHDDVGKAYPVLTAEEVEYLCIEKGTLSAAERELINDHIVLTIDMLESLPFPRKLRRVPEYAGGHHEKMDGTGYPRGLTREQMSIPARVMAIADIFEALTSTDRPYKQPLKISGALTILKKMRDKNHIDPDIYRIFIEHKVWETYAKAQLTPEQLDITDGKPFL